MIKFTEIKNDNYIFFDDVHLNMLFVVDGCLCQKETFTEYNIIANKDNELKSRHMHCAPEFIIDKILPDFIVEF